MMAMEEPVYDRAESHSVVERRVPRNTTTTNNTHQRLRADHLARSSHDNSRQVVPYFGDSYGSGRVSDAVNPDVIRVILTTLSRRVAHICCHPPS